MKNFLFIVTEKSALWRDTGAQAPLVTGLQYKSFENTVGIGEIARNEQFLLFPQSFPPLWRTFCHFHQIQSCRLQTLPVWKSMKFVVWERVKHLLWHLS